MSSAKKFLNSQTRAKPLAFSYLDTKHSEMESKSASAIPSSTSSPSTQLQRPCKKALLIAIQDVKGENGDQKLGTLPRAHADARALKNHLITRGYAEENIVMMLDSRHCDPRYWPKGNNILEQIDKFVSNPTPGSQYFFYYSGHGLQKPCRHGTEEDGQDEEIVAANGVRILDNTLRTRLVEPLDKVENIKLIAFFDCCHAETMLDLHPIRSSRIRGVSIGVFFKAIAKVILYFRALLMNARAHSTLGGKKTLFIDTGVARPHCKPCLDRIVTSPVCIANPSLDMPATTTLKGEIEHLTVICLSACRDNQVAVDDNGQQATLTRTFLDVLDTNPHLSWEQLRDQLNEFAKKVHTRCQQLTGVLLDNQEPRYSTTRHVNLNELVSI